MLVELKTNLKLGTPETLQGNEGQKVCVVIAKNNISNASWMKSKYFRQ